MPIFPGDFSEGRAESEGAMHAASGGKSRARGRSGCGLNSSHGNQGFQWDLNGCFFLTQDMLERLAVGH
jgi:hypothetical protein